MFDAFMADARAAGWICYPESCGRDLVLRAGPELDLEVWYGIEHGDTVAIEGKMHATLKLLSQALPPWHQLYPPRVATAGADWYAVLVPSCSREFRTLAIAVGVMAFVFPSESSQRQRWERRDWPTEYRVPGVRPLDLPPPVIMQAGLPGPRAVSRWKVEAVRLCLLALSRERRELRTSDFLGTRVRVPTFQRNGWVVYLGRDGRDHIYQLSDDPTRPDLAYPELVTALREEEAAAAPKQAPLLASVRS